MTPTDLRTSATSLGLAGRGRARELGVNEKTYRRWVKGEIEIPATVALAVECLLRRRGIVGE